MMWTNMISVIKNLRSHSERKQIQWITIRPFIIIRWAQVDIMPIPLKVIHQLSQINNKVGNRSYPVNNPKYSA